MKKMNFKDMYRSFIAGEYLRLYKDVTMAQVKLLIDTQKKLNYLEEQIAKQNNPKAEYYNSKYPKENLTYARTDNGKTVQIDIRNFIQVSHLFPKFTGTDDEIAMKSFKWVFDNIRYNPDKVQYGMDEYWCFPYQTLANKKGDCEDGALLMASIIISNKVPSWKVRISCGWAIEPNGNRVGHCFLPETKITTKNELTDIKYIKKGDYVLTEEGYNKVKMTAERDYTGNVYNINSSCLSSNIICTPEHPIANIKLNSSFYNKDIKNKSFNFEFTEAQKLNLNNKLIIPIDDEEIEVKDINENKARLLGYYLGDGNLAKDRYGRSCKLRFSFNSEKDLKEIQDIKNIMKEEFNIDNMGEYKCKNEKCIQLIIYNSKIARWIESYCGTANNKYLDNKLLKMNKNLQKQLLIGWINSDGCRGDYKTTYGSHKGIWLVTSYENLANDFGIILRRLRLKYSVNNRIPKSTIIKNKNITNQRRAYTYYINNVDDNLNKIKEIRNRGKIFYFKNFALVNIKNIKKDNYSGKVYNLEVEKTNTFVANNLLVHNCYLTYYSEIEDKWLVLDWCFLPNLNEFKDRVDYKEEKTYEPCWFSFNNEFAWTKGLNSDAKDLLNTKGVSKMPCGTKKKPKKK